MEIIETISRGIARLTLNRPERLNAFTQEMQATMREAFARFAHDPEVRVIVITGAGRAFCAGGDVQTMPGRIEMGFEQRAEQLRRKHDVIRFIRENPKVVIASVNGVAAGAGMALAMACDLRIAARSSKFVTAFAKVGLSGDYGLSWTLTQTVGPARARELMFLPDPVPAEEALAMGMVTRVVDDAELEAETTALAERIANGPTVALGYMKRNLHAAERGTLVASLDLEATHQMRTIQTEDHREATTAFIEKRPPVLKGR